MRTLTLRVHLNGGSEPPEQVVRADHRDIRAWLATTRPGQALAWARDEEAIQGAWLAWHAGVRAGLWSAKYEDFDRECEWVEDVEGADDEVIPTSPATPGT